MTQETERLIGWSIIALSSGLIIGLLIGTFYFGTWYRGQPIYYLTVGDYEELFKSEVGVEYQILIKEKGTTNVLFFSIDKNFLFSSCPGETVPAQTPPLKIRVAEDRRSGSKVYCYFQESQ